MPEAAVRFEGVSKVFPGRDGREVVAVRDLDLEIAAGDIVALVGTSGCGKTTTLRLINRLEEATSGAVRVDGTDVREQDPIRLRRGIGYVLQHGGLFPHLTVAENVGLVAKLEGWKSARRRARVGELLELVHLPPGEFAARFPAELSGGQRQRVGVARALVLDPPVVLLDEPFGALDPITRQQLQDEFLELRRVAGRTMVLVSHDLEEARKLADRIVVMSEGRLVQEGTWDELREGPADEFVTQFVGSDDD